MNMTVKISSEEYLTAKTSKLHFAQDAIVLTNDRVTKIPFREIKEVGIMSYGFVTPLKNIRIKYGRSVIYLLVAKPTKILKQLSEKCHQSKIQNKKVTTWLSLLALFIYIGVIFSIPYTSLLNFKDQCFILHPFVLTAITALVILPNLIGSYSLFKSRKLLLQKIFIKGFLSIWLLPVMGAINALVYCQRYIPGEASDD